MHNLANQRRIFGLKWICLVAMPKLHKSTLECPHTLVILKESAATEESPGPKFLLGDSSGRKAPRRMTMIWKGHNLNNKEMQRIE